jgi:hypothetical protein
MQRRDFMKGLLIAAPAVLIAAEIGIAETIAPRSDEVTPTHIGHEWMPNTVYNVGDRIIVKTCGKREVWTVAYAGTTGSEQSIFGSLGFR